ncbi:nuclear elongation and deformation protein 1 [Blastomyces dermatitidis ER-3]|uniref:Nuclear elongation and deformation protein 1 n=1 Tax=Ajellomyces dermatitidis (strain ER-3 / ATCC MYA-2586) TaxID=559297 RepID=A0ABP2EZS6_AJEDR|nr:nuclear elongation and deformation protein 1 [Blastomyces dermatitidis ER-3]EEQ89813.1 nuclear elongation and deformation protein 1 [Blastomyces dermatitidis ER-3]
MQYVRSISGSVSKTWNSINPATLSGAIDVIVIEQEDGTLACSPFHVRFGKFSLLRPYEKKVEFRVNGVKQDYAMKLGEGGEAFFVFETSENVPESLQTSPLVSPVASPKRELSDNGAPLQEPDYLDLAFDKQNNAEAHDGISTLLPLNIPGTERAKSDMGVTTPLSRSSENGTSRPERTAPWLAPAATLDRPRSEDLSTEPTSRSLGSPVEFGAKNALAPPSPPDSRSPLSERSRSPPNISPEEALSRAMALSRKLSISNIPSHVTETGDLMLDMTGYKSSDEDALRAEVIARKILAEELEGNYDIGALIGVDERGNLWIYSSEESKEAANRRASMHPSRTMDDAVSDPGYHSESEQSGNETQATQRHHRSQSVLQGYPTRLQTLVDGETVEPSRNYAKTLRLTSEQLKALNLKPGANEMTFSVNKATCPAAMYLWNYKVPIVISDIDGTITKSDALGHVLNMIGRDWTHLGVAKLYTDIVSNGYNLMYLTSRSTGQADTTRTYLSGIVQEGYKLPKGPVIMSPDRTIAALRREIYLRKPEVFKMACLRDILNLFQGRKNPFYAGFGNRLTDALSYRSVNIPSSRIFTINSNAEVSLDLLSLNKYKSSYVTMRELVDHFFPPVSMLVQEGGEDFTDFTYWREVPRDLENFSATDTSVSGGEDEEVDEGSEEGDGESEVYDIEYMGVSYISMDHQHPGDGGEDLADSMLEGFASEDQAEASDLENEDGGSDVENKDHFELNSDEDEDADEDGDPDTGGGVRLANLSISGGRRHAEVLHA